MAAAERTKILLNATVIMLPVIVGTVAFAWWFRAGNERALRRPDWAYSGTLEIVVWSVPVLVIIFHLDTNMMPAISSMQMQR